MRIRLTLVLNSGLAVLRLEASLNNYVLHGDHLSNGADSHVGRTSVSLDLLIAITNPRSRGPSIKGCTNRHCRELLFNRQTVCVTADPCSRYCDSVREKRVVTYPVDN